MSDDRTIPEMPLWRQALSFVGMVLLTVLVAAVTLTQRPELASWASVVFAAIALIGVCLLASADSSAVSRTVTRQALKLVGHACLIASGAYLLGQAFTGVLPAQS